MIPTWRTIILCGRYLELHEQGPVRYSGFDLCHPECTRANSLQRGALAFWIWVPPSQRLPYQGRSLVPNVSVHELERLATGELIEIRHNYVAPAELPREGFLQWLWPIWIRKSKEQTGYVPEQALRKSILDSTPQAQQLEQARSRIVITGE